LGGGLLQQYDIGLQPLEYGGEEGFMQPLENRGLQGAGRFGLNDGYPITLASTSWEKVDHIKRALKYTPMTAFDNVIIVLYFKV